MPSPSGSHSRRRYSHLCRPLEIEFVDIHQGTISSCPVGEAEALVEPAGRKVGLVDSDVHGVRAPVASLAKSRLHECASQTPPPLGGDDVQLRQVALQASAPDGGTETKHGQPIWCVTGEQNDSVAAVE